jgi:hypothetical protein
MKTIVLGFILVLDVCIKTMSSKNKTIDPLTKEEHELLFHAPLGFCPHCKQNIYVPYCVHEKFQCELSPRYVGDKIKAEIKL